MPPDLGNPGDKPGEPDELGRLRAFLSERAEAPGLVKNNVELDRYDARLFRELLDAEAELRALAGRAGRDAPRTFAPLLLDLFASFYKMVPEMLDPASVDPAHLRANRPVVERLREDEGTMIARLTTATDEVASALATVEAGKRILEELRRRPELLEWMDRQASPGAERQTTRETPAGAAPPPRGTSGAPERAEDSPDPEDQPAAGAEDRTADPASAADLRALARAASQAASGEAEGHAAAVRGWGLRPADLRVVPLRERLELARKLRTRRMRDLADLLGRMSNHRRASERRKLKASRDEVHGVEISGELHRALPSEIAGAFGSKNPDRKRDFYRRLSERSVPSYSLRTDEPVGEGPIVAMIDSSWSMSGEPMEWASAVALALAHAASGRAGRGARRVHAIFFNAKIVLEVELAPGEKDVRKFLELGTVEAGGGTEYVPPTSRALEILSEGPPEYGEGTTDLLLVTDGVCELPDEFAARLREEKSTRGFKLVSVLVGDHARAGSVEAFSDRVIRAHDLARASGARDAAGELFESL